MAVTYLMCHQLIGSVMEDGKNKCLIKGSKKETKKKAVDPFSKKNRYDVKAPAMLNIRNTGKTVVVRTQGTKITSDGLRIVFLK
ncbi:40S ribosomal protein S3a-like [Ailuropoda melanoleuca]|uniref:40S ribosomal protein S3a-like n=1 Tax=Ailuropoda melanoleuca TaxID=9646 RepID=UPI0014943758|nr:40S ribosomal protein S3a-like [Ailuropoda melanoleuca]